MVEDTESDDAQLQDAVRKITRRLRSLERMWPPGLALDSIDGILRLQARGRGDPMEAGKELARFPGIASDGGGS